uniref:Uncharacterized protein n=1 Tax=Anguilla anguilla TaxID=7936 RepID=A0A0E9RUH1_ANGAN
MTVLLICTHIYKVFIEKKGKIIRFSFLVVHYLHTHY